MTSKIKVDNINKVSDDSNIINKCGTNITMGQNGDTVILPNGVTEQVQSGGAIQVQSGGSITIASGATITNNGTAVGLGRTGTVDWATTPVTATFTAANGVGYFANTSGGAFNMNLPAGVAGAIVSVADYTRTFQTNNLTIVPNGSEKIGGIAQDASLSVSGQSATFIYVDGTEGWINIQETQTSQTGRTGFVMATGGTETTVGNDKIHTFTGPGTFCVAALANTPACNEISYMVIAGGGGGGGSFSGGGGGAGGFREDKSPITPYTASPLDGAGPISITAGSFPIVIGGGGTGGPPNVYPRQGTSGVNSTFSTITSAGGGGGGGKEGPGANNTGRDGGSGGGGGGYCSAFPGPSGSGNTPPVSPRQGEPGGNATQSGPDYGAGGGGGATAVGVAGQSSGSGSGNGGAGATTSINNSPTGYAGGGGGGASPSAPQGTATDGGGAGAASYPGPGTAGTTNTGGGGGGAGCATGGNGGSGIVIIRYKFQ